MGAAVGLGLGEAEHNGFAHDASKQHDPGHDGDQPDAFGQNAQKGLDQDGYPGQDDDYPGQDDGEEWATRDAGPVAWRNQEGTASGRRPARGLSWAPGTKPGDVGATDSMGGSRRGLGRTGVYGEDGEEGYTEEEMWEPDAEVVQGTCPCP